MTWNLITGEAKTRKSLGPTGQLVEPCIQVSGPRERSCLMKQGAWLLMYEIKIWPLAFTDSYTDVCNTLTHTSGSTHLNSALPTFAETGSEASYWSPFKSPGSSSVELLRLDWSVLLTMATIVMLMMEFCAINVKLAKCASKAIP